jgi:NADPH-dependent 2,4-dienoyl-CoA reductase/sulfur reductase-like enzyme
VLKTLAPELGLLLAEEMARHEIEVHAGVEIDALEQAGEGFRAHGDGFEAEADMVLVATGARPTVELAREAGCELGEAGAIGVNTRMETNLPDVFAAGDCVETWHNLLRKNCYLPLGTTAHKQGRVAGENAVGGDAEFAGSLGTQAVKVFGLVAARTGLKDDEARKEGLDPLTVHFECDDHKAYYPGATRMHVRLTGERSTGRLLGAQIVGAADAEVSKRVDVFAAAIHHGMRVAELSDLDLSYTPPLSSPWDPVQMAAQAWLRTARSL